MMLINNLVKEIVMYDDKIEIFFHKPTQNNPDESRGCFVYTGEYGSCKTSRTDDSKGISGTQKQQDASQLCKWIKKEPKTNTDFDMCSF